MSPSLHEAECRVQSLYTNKKGLAAQSSSLAHLGWRIGATGGVPEQVLASVQWLPP